MSANACKRLQKDLINADETYVSPRLATLALQLHGSRRFHPH